MQELKGGGEYYSLAYHVYAYYSVYYSPILQFCLPCPNLYLCVCPICYILDSPVSQVPICTEMSNSCGGRIACSVRGGRLFDTAMFKSLTNSRGFWVAFQVGRTLV